jgi:hypothetical protein
MSTRWFAGLFLFALGFASALLLRLPAASAGAVSGIVEGTLKYVDEKDQISLVYPEGGGGDYLVIASGKTGPEDGSAPQVSYEAGVAKFLKSDVQSLLVLRLTPVALWQGELIRCDDQPVLCALPPRPPPPIDPAQWSSDYRFVKPGSPGGMPPG